MYLLPFSPITDTLLSEEHLPELIDSRGDKVSPYVLDLLHSDSSAVQILSKKNPQLQNPTAGKKREKTA